MRTRWMFRSGAVLVTVAASSLFLEPVVAGAQTPPAAGSSQAPLTASQAKSLSTNVTKPVIVVLKNQESALPDTRSDQKARAAAVAGTQKGLLSELSETHAAHVTSLQFINAITGTVSPGEESRLEANPDVAEVVPDAPIPLVSGLPTVSKQAVNGAAAGSLASACAANGKVQLDPQAVEAIHAAEPSGPSAQSLGYTGSGVKVAFIADGLDITDPDFIRADGQRVFVDYQDFSGTGTDAATDGGEAFLDASSIAAQGREVYNVDSFTGTSGTCNIRILGVAPGASLVGLNVFGSSDFAYNSVFLEAINYAVNVDHVNVLNESFGSNPFPDQGSLDLTKMANDAAVAAGVTVTVSSGDAGVTNTIGSPATDPEVISAGASTTYRAYAQTGIGGITLPGVTGYLNNNISGLSSAGYDQSGGTVDVVAPGDLNWALCSPKQTAGGTPQYAACANFLGQPSKIELTGGTSEAAPLTAGTAALVIQAYEEAHGGNAPTPAQVKQIIVSTAEDISAPGDQQGAGLIDAYKAVEAAASYPGTSSSKGHALLDSATQLNAVGAEGASQSFSETVTNTGKAAQTVSLSSRKLGAYSTVSKKTVTLADSTDNLAEVEFNVPAGEGRLNASIAYQAAGPSTDFSAGDNLSLFTPSGQLAEYDLPQGAGNYGNAQVADPQAGTWTALIYGSPSADGGSVGPVAFAASVAKWTTFGHLSTSSLTLAGGASGTFKLSVADPSTPGDEAGSIVLTSSAGQPAFEATDTIPVTLRALIPTPHPSTSFTGTLTGGNGRDFGTGVSEYYQFETPSGLAELNASVSTTSSANTFFAELIDPVTGEAASTATSGIPATSATGGAIAAEPGAQLHVLAPDPGLWTLVINFYNQVSGTAISQPFDVTLDSTPVPVTAALPDSAKTTLTAGKAKTVYVKVTNTGSTPEAYFVDARLDQTTTLAIQPITTSQIEVPINSTNLPLYIVPTHTTSITASATAPAPIFFDYWWAFGDPDLISSSAPYSDTASGTFNASPVVAGEWGITPFRDGPDGANGVATVTADTSFTATTEAFDPAVTSPSGDFWLAASNPGETISPVVVGPGQTAKIPVTVTPDASPGSTVTGTLYVDDLTTILGGATNNEVSPNVEQASDLAAIPYEYTVAKG